MLAYDIDGLFVHVVLRRFDKRLDSTHHCGRLVKLDEIGPFDRSGQLADSCREQTNLVEAQEDCQVDNLTFEQHTHTNKRGLIFFKKI